LKLFPRKQTILFFDQKCFPKLNIFTTFEKARCFSYQFYLFIEILKKNPLKLKRLPAKLISFLNVPSYPVQITGLSDLL